MDFTKLYMYKVVTIIEKSMVNKHAINYIKALMTDIKFEKIYIKRVDKCKNSEILDIFKDLFKEYYYLRTNIIGNVSGVNDSFNTIPIEQSREIIDITLEFDICRVYMSYNIMTDDIVVFIMLNDGKNYDINEKGIEVFNLRKSVISLLKYMITSIALMGTETANSYHNKWKEIRNV